MAAPSEPAPRSTTPLGTLIVAPTLYVPAASMTTWFFPLQPSSALWIAVAALPACTGTVAQIVVRTGRPSSPSGFPVGVSARMPGFQVVVKSGLSRPGGAALHAPPSHVAGPASTFGAPSGPTPPSAPGPVLASTPGPLAPGASSPPPHAPARDTTTPAARPAAIHMQRRARSGFMTI